MNKAGAGGGLGKNVPFSHVSCPLIWTKDTLRAKLDPGVWHSEL